MNNAVSLKLGTVFLTLVLLFGLPFWAFLKTGRPFLEWTLLIGIFMTTAIFYCHGPGYRPLAGERKNRFHQSIPFWLSFSYTIAASFLTYLFYGEYF
ncbi:hypothetical protein D3H55_12480 [Bacillus salacetis]|uniref:Uncharacterized protein n=1 Tax=Bacillus salacetis TaxID=2315464 RepID=A0A3A1QW86_9BACI|nr:hypothetical protein [Bacillus salacetis]RIW32693.1 hypothetical protein D3H55_12480 [Bacillus salacetis]